MIDKATPMHRGQRVRYSGEGTYESRGSCGPVVGNGDLLYALPPDAVLEVLPDPEPAEIARLRGWTVWGPAAFANAVDAVAALVARLQQEAQR